MQVLYSAFDYMILFLYLWLYFYTQILQFSESADEYAFNQLVQNNTYFNIHYNFFTLDYLAEFEFLPPNCIVSL